MSKVIYDSSPKRLTLRLINPFLIFKDLYKYHELIASMTMRNFRSMYKASYLGVAWQILLPLIMLAIFYFVFGVIMGGRFNNLGDESRLDFALALFVGLGMFNFLSINIGNSPSIITSHQAYVKTLLFPLEVLPVVTVLTNFLNLVINILLTLCVFLVAKGMMHLSAICVLFYLSCIFLVSLGLSWWLSATAVFFRDIVAIVSPITIILMFMCPIFYPASMVPNKIKWIVNMNPIAIIIEEVRGCMLYGIWPSLTSVIFLTFFSLGVAILGYCFFMRSKDTFADFI